MFVVIRKQDLWVTKHAADKMQVEGLSAEQLCLALEQGARFQQTEGYLSVYTYFSVAWKKVGDKYKIKTVYINK